MKNEENKDDEEEDNETEEVKKEKDDVNEEVKEELNEEEKKEDEVNKESQEDVKKEAQEEEKDSEEKVEEGSPDANKETQDKQKGSEEADETAKINKDDDAKDTDSNKDQPDREEPEKSSAKEEVQDDTEKPKDDQKEVNENISKESAEDKEQKESKSSKESSKEVDKDNEENVKMAEEKKIEESENKQKDEVEKSGDEQVKEKMESKHADIEEDKKDGSKGIEDKSVPIKRRDSKFELQKVSVMYRPEFIYDKRESQKDIKMWDLMSSYLGSDIKSIQRQIVNHVEYTLARTRFNFDNNGCYYATAYSVRDRLVESWNDTYQHIFEQDPKCIYYMSMEYLLGRMLQNALVNLGQENSFKEALDDLGYNLEEIYEEENDPGLGNGGLGRLAACFLDSLTTLEYPAWGYGIRYSYGIFKQEIRDGYQVEMPDYWLGRGNTWEIERLDVIIPVRFYGKVRTYKENGIERKVWEGGENVRAMAYDIPIPGYNAFNTNNLRLWRACPSVEFDFKSFNTGDYFGAVKAKQKAESISSVLYPNDITIEGKELRLKQEYFFCAATLEDIVNRFLKKHDNWDDFPEKVSIQLNDTHPALSIVEMMRLLVDQYKLPWEQAWNICCQTFSYTNHTVMVEALEKWDVSLMESLLPRHLEIIYLINHLFLQDVRKSCSNDESIVRNLSLIEEGDTKKVRMANLCIIASHKVNGVARLHSELIRNWLFKDFVTYYNKQGKKSRDKFINVTNGVTPRRWLLCANPRLADLITRRIGHEEWITDLSLISDLKTFADEDEVIKDFSEIRRYNKVRLAKWVKENCNGLIIDTDSLFDVFVKRIHEYKRQLMAALYIVHRYLWIKEMRPDAREQVVRRTFLIGGKAAPGYDAAKKTIKLINMIANVINNDPDVNRYMKVAFMPNYSVSNAQVIIPAADLSQHISTAGTEASGTSNMKFAMNGCLIIGTMDGANVEIAEEIGKENMFIFGANVDEVSKYRKMMAEGKRDYVPPSLSKVFDALYSGRFGDLSEMHWIFRKVTNGEDHYIVCWDFQSYLDCQSRVDECYKDQKKWMAKAIASIACSGKFSTDRTIKEYADNIW